MSEQTPNIGGTTPRTERLQALVDSLDAAFTILDPDANLRIVAHVEVLDLNTAITYSRGYNLRESIPVLIDTVAELSARAGQPEGPA